MNPVAAALETKVLSMALTDVRATIAQSQAATQAGGQAQPADVILELSTAAQQLLGR
jgi:hypothetical protein